MNIHFDCGRAYCLMGG